MTTEPKTKFVLRDLGILLMTLLGCVWFGSLVVTSVWSALGHGEPETVWGGRSFLGLIALLIFAHVHDKAERKKQQAKAWEDWERERLRSTIDLFVEHVGGKDEAERILKETASAKAAREEQLRREYLASRRAS